MRGFVFTEDDRGSKRAAKKAVSRTKRALERNFRRACREYWMEVWEIARSLCPIDTGTLMNSIRIIWMVGYGGGPEAPFAGEVYEVAISQTTGTPSFEMTAMIKAGGEGFINPRTGWYVDYAQAVHDGTRYMAARPFLTDAIIQCEPYREQIMSRYIDGALSNWEREY